MMNNEQFKKAYEQISVNDQLHKELLDIPDRQSKRQQYWKKCASILILVAILGIVADLTCYAAAGNGLAEQIRIYINGKIADNFVVEEDGKIIIHDDRYEDIIIMSSTGETPANIPLIIVVTDPVTAVEERDDKVWLVVEKGEIEIDITDQLKQGSAEGEFTFDNRRYAYRVTKRGEEYDVSLQAVGE